jgi:hypothetical protein
MAARFGTILLFFVNFLVEGQTSASLNYDQINERYAVAVTQELPTTSCTIIERTKNNMRCFARCMVASDIQFLFSRDSGTGSCACCYLPLSGPVLNGSEWKSFLKRGESSLRTYSN